MDIKLYKEYLSDYIQEATEEMNNKLGIKSEEPEVEEKGRKDVYKHNFYLKDNFQDKYISPVLAKSNNRNSIIEFVYKFIDDHNEQLSTSGPVYSFSFGDKETNFFYNLFNLNKEEIMNYWFKMIEETYYGKISKFFTGWLNNAPHKLIFVAMLIEAIQKGYDDIIEACKFLWSFCEYPILYREYWKTNVRPDVMEFTIERLGNKFKIKTKNLNNLLALLQYEGESSVNSKYEQLKEGADNVYADFMQRMRNQLNNTLRNISREYYNNIQNNATIHNQTDEFEDGSKAEQDGSHSIMVDIIEYTLGKINLSGINNSLIKIVANGAKVDKDNLENFINLIIKDKNSRLSKFVENIILAYFTKFPTTTSLGSGFVNFALSLFKSIGNSKDEVYQETNQILTYWLFEIIHIDKLYQRVPTIATYKRALYNYFVFLINSYN